ncbi:MAG TPA: DUF3574 domain-containing protein, partial [Candidatus Binatia bacterium]|nr:DUF3574 domain-containing protein [Candidatus Binatia bacterium]
KSPGTKLAKGRFQHRLSQDYWPCGFCWMGTMVQKVIGRNLVGSLLVLACAGSILSRATEPAAAIPGEQQNVATPGACSSSNQGQLLARTELYFGRAKPDGSMVSDEEFRAFLDDIITPRFPNGLTVLSGAGQFRGSSGMITREGSKFVILLYRAGEKDSSARIEEIRASYRKTFAQESVLRVDGESCVYF